MFCDGHRGSKIKKLGLGPQNISQYYLGLEAAFKKIEESHDWYRKELERLGKGQNYEEHLEIQKYSQAKRALENVLRDIGKMQAYGKKDTP
ncbi:MAG: hypothetical protein HC840_00605 [Leptolyngbyaceae cyanobacterium RM2_2_4]|nr:hypothetical protein [Leptolyngbyaceae cyanobacterium RM2_2_4]